MISHFLTAVPAAAAITAAIFLGMGSLTETQPIVIDEPPDSYGGCLKPVPHDEQLWLDSRLLSERIPPPEPATRRDLDQALQSSRNEIAVPRYTPLPPVSDATRADVSVEEKLLFEIRVEMD